MNAKDQPAQPLPLRPQASSHTLVIIGGGAGGIGVAARLKRLLPQLDILLIDPASHHDYQPGWTLVGAGLVAGETTRRPMADCIPSGVRWLQDRVRRISPDCNQLDLESGTGICYRFLIVAAGLQLNWDAIEGLEESLGKYGVSSNYSRDHAAYTWTCIQQFKGGVALFTQPAAPIKCAGAPQKILYLAADFFRRQHISADLRFMTAATTLFGVTFYARALEAVMARTGAVPC